MKVGDLVRIICKDGAVSHSIGVYLGADTAFATWGRFFIDNRIHKLYKSDYTIEVINESR